MRRLATLRSSLVRLSRTVRVASRTRFEALSKRQCVGILAQGEAVARSKTLRLISLLMPTRQACSGGAIATAIVPRAARSRGGGGGEDMDAEDEDGGGGDAADAARHHAASFANASVMTSKLTHLIVALRAIRDADATSGTTSKSLVFSQFGSTLRWLQHELPRHGFDHRTLTGDMSKVARAAALRDFREDPPTTVFLLSVRAGACGINLTTANHVFMLEPCLNPALEAQVANTLSRSAVPCHERK